MASDIRIEVAVPCPLRNTFTYSAPIDLKIEPGQWVEVPFGRRRVTGLVMGYAEQDIDLPYPVKSISKPLPHLPPIEADLLVLLSWSERYYHAAPWDLVNTMFPLRLLSTQPNSDKYWKLRPNADLAGLAKARRQLALAEWMQGRDAANKAEIEAAGFSAALLRELEKRDLLEPIARAAEFSLGTPTHEILLNADQRVAADAIDLGQYQTYLMQGPTGSGKTEVYLAAAQRAIDAGLQVLILVPEIGLTPQTEERFRRALTARIATYHSSMTDSTRRQVWNSCKSAELDLVIGTRSAIFLPFAKLGLVVMDEEHDQSYKQQEGWRYHARQISAMRTRHLGIPLLMGSATPSFDSLLNVERGRYQLLSLHRRHESRPMPEWQLTEPSSNLDQSPMTPQLLEHIDAALERKEQVLIFLNRRGFAPTFECQSCRWVATCDDCSCRLTAHRQSNRLLCHQCGVSRAIPQRCDQCQSQRMQMLGVGTERLESFLANRYPEFPVLRVDRDSTRHRGKLEELLGKANLGQPGILIGTQMLAKGHHFPAVSLAIILGVDQGLLSADPCALEQTAQLCIQVAGRAGRGDSPGRAIIETGLASHPAVILLTSAGYEAFARSLLREREVTGQPPFSFWAILGVEHSEYSVCEAALHQVARALDGAMPAEAHYLGPMPSLLERRGNRYRYQIQLFAPVRSALHQTIDIAIDKISLLAPQKKIRWSIDIDPVGMD
jgi:primosomal protein N' (replication factor Y) (superfamily II helicase)